MTWWLASGRARQVRVMWQNSRCSILELVKFSV